MDKEYYCTNCHATLNEQNGFDAEKLTWVCEKCNMLLIGDNLIEGENHPGVVWFCDECHDVLNNQEYFSDEVEYWSCSKCGCRNPLNFQSISNIPMKSKLIGMWKRSAPALKKVAKWTGAGLAVLGGVVVATILAIKPDEADDNDDSPTKKYKIIFDGEDEDILFDSEESAEEYASYLSGCKHIGAEILEMSNPGDYSMDDYEEAEWEVEEVEVCE